MNRNTNSNGTGSGRLVGLALTTALSSAALAGCAASAPPAAVSAGKAEESLAEGSYVNAIEHAEQAVMADGRNASYRAVLGAAYLEAGRFSSAAASFQDSIDLGDTSPRTALSLALALTAEGKNPQAVAVLEQWEGAISSGDLGLAYSLAGAPERGIHVLSNALRNGENTGKVRQNLAYSYALAGRWREARVMASEDVPAGMVSDRIAEWAAQVHPAAYRVRVATLLDVPADRGDAGQPIQLALSNFPTADQLAADATAMPAPTAVAEAAPPMPAPTTSGELAPIGDPVDARVAQVTPPARAVASHTGTARTVAPATATAVARSSVPRPSLSTDSVLFVSEPVVQPLPERRTRSVASVATAARAVPGVDGAHLVQLGSFTSERGAQRAWSIYVQRYPELANHDMVITRAVVRGKEYYRVSAAGYDASSSRAMCGRVNSSATSEGCIAYAESRPLPGAIDTGRRLAMN